MTAELSARPPRHKSDAAVLHVRFGGRNFDISMIGLDLTPASSDDEVKYQIADYLEISDDRLNDYVIDRHDNGNLTLRLMREWWGAKDLKKRNVLFASNVTSLQTRQTPMGNHRVGV